jgi:hypothetical protein
MIFDWMNETGQKYKADKSLSSVNKFRLPINLLKYKNKVGHTDWTVENVDALVDDLITHLESITKKPIELMSDKEMRKWGKTWSNDKNVRIGYDNLKMLEQYKLNKMKD